MTQSRGNYNALTWLQDELQKSLAASLQSVQTYIDDPQQSESLSRCVEHLYQVNGTLEMLNLDGAQMLAAEMQSIAGYMRSFPEDKQNSALETLTRGLILLPTYLQKVNEKFPDNALCLLDSINELRLLRDKPAIAETDVFTPDLSISLPDSIAPNPAHTAPPLELERHKIAHVFQHLLLTWMREQDDKSLRKMRGILRHLRLQCLQEKTTLFWWVAEALLEGLAHRGIRDDSSAKQLIGKMASPIRLVCEGDENSLLAGYPETLLKQLLLLVARSSSYGPLVTGVKASFGLTFYDQASQLIGHSDAALQEAQNALLEQLEELKERISQFDTAEDQADEAVNDISLQLLSMADTLTLLQHQTQSDYLHKQHTALQKCLATDKSYHDQLTSLADDLLQIEALLRKTDAADAIHRQLQKTVLTECLNELASVKELLILQSSHQTDNDETVQQNLANSLNMLAGSLDVLDISKASQLFSSLATKFNQDASSFNDPKAQQDMAEILASAEIYLENLHQTGQADENILQTALQTLQHFGQSTEQTDELQLPEIDFSADKSIEDEVSAEDEKLSSVDLYLRSLEDKAADIDASQLSIAPPDQESFAAQDISNSEEQVEALELPEIDFSADNSSEVSAEKAEPLKLSSVDLYIEALEDRETDTETLQFEDFQPPVADLSETITADEPLELQDYQSTDINFDQAESETSEPVAFEDQIPFSAESADSSESSDSYISGNWQFEEHINPEIAEVFVEEANEVLDDLQQLLPIWSETPENGDLPTIRRHFHTLKGSGRMAGATTIADMAQAVEHLLNQILEDALPVSDEIMALVMEAVPEVNDCLGLFTQAQSDFTESAAALTILAQQLTEQESVLDSADEDEEDRALRDIFYQEAEQHLQNLFAETAVLQVGKVINKSMLSAAHSLKGCANIAGVKPVAIIATQLDQTFRNLYHQQQTFTEKSISELNDIVMELSQLLQAVKTGEDEPDIRLLDRRIFELCPKKSEQSHTARLDPEQLVSFLEETDGLLNEYSQQLAAWQQTDSEPPLALQQTLNSLAENAENSVLPQLAALYQLMQRLISHPQSRSENLKVLLEEALEIVNEQIEALIQHKTPADFTLFREQIRATLTAFDTVSTVEVDPEILEAFTEEAAELLVSTDRAIKQWQSEPENPAGPMQLQRDLHTLKGGARLTATMAMADLTHQIETLVLSVTDQQETPDDGFFSLLQRCQDRLTEMQEQLASRSDIPAANDLLQEIQQYSGYVPADIDNRDTLTQPASTAEQLPAEANSFHKAPADNAKSSSSQSSEKIRVRADLLDYLSNFAGEVSITRDQVTQQHGVMHQQLEEMEETVSRLHEQLRKLEIETETQILYRYEDTVQDTNTEFDPLELDRFSTIQQLSRSLTETVNDLNNISRSMGNVMRETDILLLQQSRLNTDLQQGLMHTRLLPFNSIVPRLERIVRQTNSELNKQSQLLVSGADLELDRTILDRLVAPIEHILRNAIAHGLETADERSQQGKEQTGRLQINMQREGSEVVITIADDGQGLNIEKIKQRAISQNLIDPNNIPNEQTLIQLILTSGFSTADTISQLAGRGVGMDVVSNEIRALKGRLSISSQPGKGTQFHLRLPLTLSVMQALLISVNQQQFAVPLSAVNAGERISIQHIGELMAQQKPTYTFHGEHYDFIPLGNLLGQPLNLLENLSHQMPLLLFRSGDIKIALAVDSIDSNREIVIKSVGQQLGQISAINGATILGDGRVIFILDIPTLIEDYQAPSGTTNLQQASESFKKIEENRNPLAMIVDDSITMRKATEGLLTRLGFDVVTAKDGVDALARLYEQTPDIVLLDVEMPRMDGFEFASIIRNDSQFKHLPIIMITSRTGDKHRQRAMSIGVNAYLGKPYQDDELIISMKQQLAYKYPNEKR
ncbi:Hpt domain-containing protein [uncultured Methylophaga sp.]|jgi:chemosensory pili system protein ChpA (sensor histidine kinase/response regulator)|uniref:hybrid sensor histidine kinase/response regulator n=2 Tax=Methylophaga TaxID=40222 RepID=UPI0030D6D56E|tara:strand:- start:954 stop:6680 length:5727 start_codon:yes stop_codon:yes gene_type:complete